MNAPMTNINIILKKYKVFEMNKYDKLEKIKRINDNKNMLDMYSRTHINCIRINSNETLEHFLVKAWQCYQLKSLNIPFVCEARMKKLDRIVDIFRLDNGDMIEIETGKSYKKKDAIETINTKEEIPKLIDILNPIPIGVPTLHVQGNHDTNKCDWWKKEDFCKLCEYYDICKNKNKVKNK